MAKTIGNPLSWTANAVAGTGRGLAGGAGGLISHDDSPPVIRQITVDDLREALRKGFDDFAVFRTDVMFLVVVYPVIGLSLAYLALGQGLLHIIFPLVAGFALLGPVAATGLYAMSRAREAGQEVSWGTAWSVFRSDCIGPVTVLGLYLLGLFIIWMFAAYLIYLGTLGPDMPRAGWGFIVDVLTTGPGWAMAIIGTAVGFVIAAIVLVTSIVSFPMLIDRRVGLMTAVSTSVAVARANPVPVAIWGLVVAAGMVIGSLPMLLGLIVVLPVLGHATWHLYRAAVAPPVV